MSKKRSYDLFIEYKLGSFFMLVFLGVALIGSFWFFHRRTNFYAHKHEDGIDVIAPFYSGKKHVETTEKKSETESSEGEIKKEGESKESAAEEKAEGSDKK